MLDARPRPRADGSGRWRRPGLLAPLAAALVLPLLAGPASAAPAQGAKPAKPVTTDYENPLAPVIPGGGTVDSCADPTVINGQTPGDDRWYLYCTTDPLNDSETVDGSAVFHRIPTMVSDDLVNWTYVNDAFPLDGGAVPAWIDRSSAFWAPEVVYSTTFEQYYMFVTVTETTSASGTGSDECQGDSAIGVATSGSPTGPWTFSDAPVVAPRPGPGTCDFMWTFDPDVLGDSIADEGILYYGSYYGGVFGTGLTLTADGATTAGPGTMVAIDNKYEGANVVERDGYYYLFVSATNCCNGALTGYSVFVGRSRSALGPFVDQQGNSLTDAQAGGTPFLTMNGNRWTGTGHNTVFQDAAGDWWTIYHAVDQSDPFFEGQPGFTKRPALLDPIDWVNGWPTVNGGAGPSDSKQPAPAGQPGQRSRHKAKLVKPQLPGTLLRAYSDEFDGTSLSSAWTWDAGSNATAPPPPYTVSGGVLRTEIQHADTNVDVDNAYVLVRDAPDGDYVVDTKVRVSIPDEGCCFNYAQAGLGVYGDEDNLVKLTNTSIWNTRQTEWAKEIDASRAIEGQNRYGNTIVGPPSEDWTYLRIVADELDSPQQRADAGGDAYAYTAYTSQDGRNWVRGGTWTHSFGPDAQTALFAMGATEQVTDIETAEFDYVRVYSLKGGPRGS